MEMNLQKYYAFVTTAECGSFTRAAELLRYSQSGISRMIQDLEKEWQLVLLERGKSGVRLTADGTKLLPYAKKLLSGYEAVQTAATQLSGLQAGLLRIGAFPSIAAQWLPGMIRPFQLDYPRLEYEILVGDAEEIEGWVLSGRADCGFTSLPAHPELEALFLEQDRLAAVLPAGHPLAGSTALSISELCDEPFILLQQGGRPLIADLFARSGLKPQLQFATGDAQAALAMVEAGLGVSVLPWLLLQRQPYRVLVKELKLPAYRDLGLVLRSKKTASLAVKRFLEYLPYRQPAGGPVDLI